MELRRKQEEAERLRMEEEDRKAALMLQAQLEKEAQEDSKYRQQLEQERRDHELALRLAQESNGQLDESPTMSRKYVSKIIVFFFCTDIFSTAINLYIMIHSDCRQKLTCFGNNTLKFLNFCKKFKDKILSSLQRNS